MEAVELLAAGGDVSTMLLLFVAWKFDKRLSRVEWRLDPEQS